MSVIALAGRRIDAADAREQRFPETNVAGVRTRLEEAFRAAGATALVCSGACGADLVALVVAGALGMRRRMILPFAAEVFRRTSVADRGANWGEVFDRVVVELRRSGDVLVLDFAETDSDAYGGTNGAIWDEAEAIALRTGEQVIGIRVWEGQSRGAGDLTEQFGELGRKRGAEVRDVATRE